MRLAKILSGALVCFCLFGCVQQPVINYKDCMVKLNDLQYASAKVNFSVSNPNVFPLSGKVSYTLFVQEKELTAGQTDTIEAEANADTDFVLEQNIDFNKIFDSAAGLIKAVLDGQESVSLRLTGHYDLNAMLLLKESIPFDQTVEIPLPSRAQVEAELRKNIQQNLQQNINNLGGLLQNL
jgi:hypothetical protein